MLQLLIAAGFIGASLWWYRHRLGEPSGAAGCVLWIGWGVFGGLSLVYLAASGPEALLFGGVVTWACCMAGTVLGSRLLMRAFPARADDIWYLTTVFIFGSGLLGFATVWWLLGEALAN